MPQLPSGRHVAIHLNQLDVLLKSAIHPSNVHQIMEITTIERLAPYTAICFLVPEDEAGVLSPKQEFRKDAQSRPPGLKVVESGFTLAQFDEVSLDWSAEDKTAFQGFLDIRCRALFEAGLEETERVRQWLMNESGALTRTLALWHKAGVHPCQEESWEESDLGSTEWDSYDMLAALGQLTMLIPKRPELAQKLGLAHDRLQGCFHSFRQHFGIPADWPDPRANVREAASYARASGWLSANPEEKQAWLFRQAIQECICLYDASSENFHADFPQQFGIIDLVVLSPAANS